MMTTEMPALMLYAILCYHDEDHVGSWTKEQDAEVMQKHPGMEHDEPFMAHVAPGKTEEIVWQFTKPGNYKFGCLVPGHFEAGMVGDIAVVGSDTPMVDGEIRKVDKEAGKITIRHDAIPNLAMPGMTMVFRAAEPALLDRTLLSTTRTLPPSPRSVIASTESRWPSSWPPLACSR